MSDVVNVCLSISDIFGAQINSYLYVLSPGTRAVQVLSLDGPGKASYVQSLDLTTAAPKVKTSGFRDNSHRDILTYLNNYLGIDLQGIATYAPL